MVVQSYMMSRRGILHYHHREGGILDHLVIKRAFLARFLIHECKTCTPPTHENLNELREVVVA